MLLEVFNGVTQEVFQGVKARGCQFGLI